MGDREGPGSLDLIFELAAALLVPDEVDVRWRLRKDGKIDLTYRERFTYLPEDIFRIAAPLTLAIMPTPHEVVSRRLLPDGVEVRAVGGPRIVAWVIGELLIAGAKGPEEARGLIAAVARLSRAIRWERRVSGPDERLFSSFRQAVAGIERELGKRLTPELARGAFVIASRARLAREKLTDLSFECLKCGHEIRASPPYPEVVRCPRCGVDYTGLVHHGEKPSNEGVCEGSS